MMRNADRIQTLRLCLIRMYRNNGPPTSELITPTGSPLTLETFATVSASSKFGSGAALCQFFGWDISLFDGAEHDTESLLSEKPDIIMFYTNDDRSMDVKMRITSA